MYAGMDYTESSKFYAKALGIGKPAKNIIWLLPDSYAGGVSRVKKILSYYPERFDQKLLELWIVTWDMSDDMRDAILTWPYSIHDGFCRSCAQFLPQWEFRVAGMYRLRNCRACEAMAVMEAHQTKKPSAVSEAERVGVISLADYKRELEESLKRQGYDL